MTILLTLLIAGMQLKIALLGVNVPQSFRDVALPIANEAISVAQVGLLELQNATTTPQPTPNFGSVVIPEPVIVPAPQPAPLPPPPPPIVIETPRLTSQPILTFSPLGSEVRIMTSLEFTTNKDVACVEGMSNHCIAQTPFQVKQFLTNCNTTSQQNSFTFQSNTEYVCSLKLNDGNEYTDSFTFTVPND